ncbi:MAG: response regulator transcription factor [Ardenticatenia bacterium]|nr:response regulator transcription factor [Ardenticatenia bacterium]
MTRVLFVDDERNIFELARLYLEQEGFTVTYAPDGEQALRHIRHDHPDLVILDIMLPGRDGWSVCKEVRQAGNQVPIIMLTAKDEDVDKILGLELGADDYMTKPFNPRELVARVKAVLRRAAAAQASAQRVYRVGNVCLDVERREVWVGAERISVRPKEFDLLLAFLEYPGRAWSREQLLDRVWGYSYVGDTRTVDVHVAGLREKLRGSSVQIETVWGYGYKLVESEPS